MKRIMLYEPEDEIVASIDTLSEVSPLEITWLLVHPRVEFWSKPGVKPKWKIAIPKSNRDIAIATDNFDWYDIKINDDGKVEIISKDGVLMNDASKPTLVPIEYGWHFLAGRVEYHIRRLLECSD